MKAKVRIVCKSIEKCSLVTECMKDLKIVTFPLYKKTFSSLRIYSILNITISPIFLIQSSNIRSSIKSWKKKIIRPSLCNNPSKTFSLLIYWILYTEAEMSRLPRFSLNKPDISKFSRTVKRNRASNFRRTWQSGGFDLQIRRRKFNQVQNKFFNVLTHYNNFQ